MPLPAINAEGVLPLGVHASTLEEVRQVFGTGSYQRQLVFSRLERIVRIAFASTQLVRLIVFGSFVTAKPEPNDVDVFLIFDEEFDASLAKAELLLLLDPLLV